MGTYLLGENTIDEYMYNLIQTKRSIANGVTGTTDTTEEKMERMSDIMFNAAFDMFKNEL
jgi:SWI/SNF-related matrix-associated actin-dependent regulator 1 of chromatin subfamily A